MYSRKIELPRISCPQSKFQVGRVFEIDDGDIETRIAQCETLVCRCHDARLTGKSYSKLGTEGEVNL